MRRAEKANYQLESVDRMVSVLKALEMAPEQSLDQVARQADLNESTALRYLLSLTHYELVERDAVSGRFRLGLSLFRLGTKSVAHRDTVTSSLSVMERLLAEFGESVNLAVRQQGQVVLLRVLESATPTRKGAHPGESDPWHATALGKAMLAYMSEEDVLEILRASPLHSYTPNTFTSEEEVLRDLQRTRVRGFALDDEESVEGLRCVAVAIRDHDGVARFALSVSGPKSRMPYQRLEEIGAAMIPGAGEVSRALGG